MTRNTCFFSVLILAFGGLAGCSSEPVAKQVAPPPDKIHGTALVMLDETTALDSALNAGGPSAYLVDGLNRYRLFFNKTFQIDPGKAYTAEGVYAQKAIDAIGDPDQGKNGYPLQASCDRVVRMAFPGLAFDVTDSYSNSLRARVKRYPARPVFLVMQIELATGADSATPKKDEAGGKEAVSVPADKQRALLVEGPASFRRRFGSPRAERIAAK